MKSFIQSALAYTVLALVVSTAHADAQLDDLLSKIDADIAAKRLSNPAGNNAIEKIWQFKALSPYDQRITSRAYRVGEAYVSFANKSISAKKYTQAQIHLDKAWMLAYLTPGLEAAQDKLDGLYSSKAVAKAAPKPKPAPKKQVAKKDSKAETAKKLAAAKAAKAKADKLAAQQRREAEAKERRLAQLRKEEEAKRKAAAKLAALEAQRKKAAQNARIAAETTKSIAEFDLDQGLIDNRETREIRSALKPICQEILDNEASIVLHTRTVQDYRWLTVRLTLCVRRLDKSFRLRHSHKIIADGEPSVSLHPGRSMSLLKQRRG
jgi:colicin import membrane protein